MTLYHNVTLFLTVAAVSLTIVTIAQCEFKSHNIPYSLHFFIFYLCLAIEWKVLGRLMDLSTSVKLFLPYIV